MRRHKRLYLIPLDVSNCYWRIGMPREWRNIFSVVVEGHKYTWRSLPCGWKYFGVFSSTPSLFVCL